jgi:hypothetical protein
MIGGIIPMANKKTSTLSKTVDKLSVQVQSPWNSAILDARQKLGEAEAGVLALKRAIQAFEELRDSGEPWPGTSEATEKVIQKASSA